MKLITAMLRSEKLEAVQTAVTQQGAHVTYISNVGDLREPTIETYRGASYSHPRPKVRLEVVVLNDLAVQDVVDAISQAAADNSEAIGSSGIFVTPLEQWVRIGGSHAQPAAELAGIGGVSRRAS